MQNKHFQTCPRYIWNETHPYSLSCIDPIIPVVFNRGSQKKIPSTIVTQKGIRSNHHCDAFLREFPR